MPRTVRFREDDQAAQSSSGLRLIQRGRQHHNITEQRKEHTFSLQQTGEIWENDTGRRRSISSCWSTSSTTTKIAPVLASFRARPYIKVRVAKNNWERSAGEECKGRGARNIYGNKKWDSDQSLSLHEKRYDCHKDFVPDGKQVRIRKR